MTSAYDPEIAPAVPLSPKLDLTDLPATREQLKAARREPVRGKLSDTALAARLWAASAELTR